MLSNSITDILTYEFSLEILLNPPTKLCYPLLGPGFFIVFSHSNPSPGIWFRKPVGCETPVFGQPKQISADAVFAAVTLIAGPRRVFAYSTVLASSAGAAGPLRAPTSTSAQMTARNGVHWYFLFDDALVWLGLVPSTETSGWSVTRKGAAVGVEATAPAPAPDPLEKRSIAPKVTGGTKFSTPKPSWLNPGTVTSRAKGRVSGTVSRHGGRVIAMDYYR